MCKYLCQSEGENTEMASQCWNVASLQSLKYILGSRSQIWRTAHSAALTSLQPVRDRGELSAPRPERYENPQKHGAHKSRTAEPASWFRPLAALTG